MESGRSTSTWSKEALGTQFGALLFGIIGIPSDNWITTENGHSGLFRYCIRGICKATSESLKTASQKVGAGLCLTAFVTGAACLGLIFLINVVKIIEHTKLTRTISTGLAFIAGCLMVIGVFTFAIMAKQEDYSVTLSWLFGLTVVASVLHPVSGFFLILDKKL